MISKSALEYEQEILSLKNEISNLKTALSVLKLKHEREKDDKPEIPYDYYRNKV